MAAQTGPDPEDLQDSNPFKNFVRPFAPSVMIPYQGNIYGLPVYKMHVKTEFYLSTAFVKMVGVWRNITKYSSDCLFALPLNGSVTSVNIEVGDRVFETIVISKAQASELQKEESKRKNIDNTNTAADADYEEYKPNLFRLPIENVKSKDLIRITVYFVEQLRFTDSNYHFTLPMKFKANLLPPKKTFNDVISVECVIHSVTSEGGTQYNSDTHALTRTEKECTSAFKFTVSDFNKPDVPAWDGAEAKPKSVDFVMQYSQCQETLHPTLVYVDNQAEEGVTPSGVFSLVVSPPQTKVNDFCKRNIIFLLDRSGSMRGRPFEQAVNALNTAIDALREDDMFSVVCFDHRQEFLSESDLVKATPDNKENASRFVATHQPERGGTDIKVPLEWALHLLEKYEGDEHILPFIVLVTDGCVKNEREICLSVCDVISKTRILTLGIGSYCNGFFLRMLATMGRGFCDVVFEAEKIESAMSQLLNASSVPLLTNLSLNEPDGCELTLYPDPLPDLFLDAPLTVSGTFEGPFPAALVLQGCRHDGSPTELRIESHHSDVIPVVKVLVRQRLDVLTARAWLEESQSIQDEVVELSCATNMPSAYTTMVAFETTRSDDYDAKDSDKIKKLPLHKNKKALAALGVGGGVLIGAAIFSFGDIGATTDNLGAFFGGDLDLGCCGDFDACDCGDCDCHFGDCDCGDCLVC